MLRTKSLSHYTYKLTKSHLIRFNATDLSEYSKKNRQEKVLKQQKNKNMKK